MQPFGQSVRPEISLDFEIDGKRYALRKAFCRRSEAELTWTGGRATGDAAEDKLQELLRLALPGTRKDATKPEHQGVWGLFWVEQGTSFKALRMSGGSRQTLTSALEGEVGQVLGGDRGRALLLAIRSRFDEMFTEKTGRPRDSYKKSIEAADELDREVARLEGALRAYEDKVNDLEGVRSRLLMYEREGTLARAQASLRTAEVAHAARHRAEGSASRRARRSRACAIEAGRRRRAMVFTREEDRRSQREREARRTLPRAAQRRLDERWTRSKAFSQKRAPWRRKREARMERPKRSMARPSRICGAPEPNVNLRICEIGGEAQHKPRTRLTWRAPRASQLRLITLNWHACGRLKRLPETRRSACAEWRHGSTSRRKVGVESLRPTAMSRLDSRFC